MHIANAATPSPLLGVGPSWRDALLGMREVRTLLTIWEREAWKKDTDNTYSLLAQKS